MAGLLRTFLVVATRILLLLLALARFAVLFARIVLVLVAHGDTVLLLPALGKTTNPDRRRSGAITAGRCKTP